jgi:hypothetical protein
MVGMRDGHRNECKACNLADKKRRYQANRKAEIERVQRWRHENPIRFREYQRIRRQRPEVKKANRAGHLKRKYGITIEQYEAMLALQGGGCAICGRKSRAGISLHIDHDHETGQIRGLLCFPCNNLLGDIEDDLERLREAASYLERAQRDPEIDAAIRRRVDELKAMAA